MANMRRVDGAASLHPVASITLIVASLAVYLATLAFLAFMAMVEAIERVIGPCFACSCWKILCISFTMVAMAILSICVTALYHFVFA